MPSPHPITVTCVLRSGGIYDAEWVAKLQRGVARHLTLPHRFVCHSDVDVPSDVERIPLVTDWPGWWSKLELFATPREGVTLYFDLDTVVVGSLDAIAAYPHRFTMAHEFYRPHLLCSTAMAWSGDYAFIAEKFVADPARWMHEYDKVLPGKEGRIGDQAWVEDHQAADTFRDLFGERSIASWKVHVRDGGGLNGSEAVVAFHGSEKPHDLQHIKWIRDAMDLIQRDDGFWWPADDDWCYRVIHTEVADADIAVNLTRGKTLAVQAGGNVGVWASHLARQFERVVTVEPDATNYECLKRNVPVNVGRIQAAFGADPGWIDLTRVNGNAGAHYVGGPGSIPIITIDSLDLPACDLLILDVEGSEPAALYGAEQTIRQFRPVIMFEEKGLSERYYGIKRGTAEKWLKDLGYTVRGRVRADVIMAHG